MRFFLTIFIISNLYGMQPNSPDLFISSRNTSSVKRYDGTTGAYIDDFVKTGSGGLSSTQEIMFGFDGNLLVTGRGNSAILKYNGETGEFISNFTSGYALDEPTKMTLGPDSLIYVSQWGQQKGKVARFNGMTGAFVDEFTSIPLNQGCGHAWDGAGNLYVASFGSADVRKFDTQGNFISIFTNRSGGFVNLWFGEDGYLFVIDWNTGTVLRFDGQTGAFKNNFITGMQRSEGFALGADGLLYICDWQANKVNRYDSSGNFVDTFSSGGGLLAPNGVAFKRGKITSIETELGAIPHKIELNQNYPNPFNPSTTITYAVPKASRVALKVYDLSGATVATLVDEFQSAGTQSIVWNGTDESGDFVSSGTYFYRVENSGEARKMVFLK